MEYEWKVLLKWKDGLMPGSEFPLSMTTLFSLGLKCVHRINTPTLTAGQFLLFFEKYFCLWNRNDQNVKWLLVLRQLEISIVQNIQFQKIVTVGIVQNPGISKRTNR